MKTPRFILLSLSTIAMFCLLSQPAVAASNSDKRAKLYRKASALEQKRGPIHPDTIKARLDIVDFDAKTGHRYKGLYNKDVYEGYCRVYATSMTALGPAHKLTKSINAKLDVAEKETLVMARTHETQKDWLYAGNAYNYVHMIRKTRLGEDWPDTLQMQLKAADAYAAESHSLWSGATSRYLEIMRLEKKKGSPDGKLIATAESSLKALLARIEKQCERWESDRYLGYAINGYKTAIAAWREMGPAYEPKIANARKAIDRMQPRWDAHMAREDKRIAAEDKAEKDRKHKEWLEQQRIKNEQEANRIAAEKNKPKELCSWCDGRGRKGCWACQATGRSRDHNGRDYGMCRVCSGHGYQVCNSCKGTGRKQ